MIIYISLGNTYYNQPFFNISMVDNHLIAGNEQDVKIQLGKNGETIFGKINRTANRNGTPRIMARAPYIKWIQENYNLGDQMKIEVINPNFLVIYSKENSN